MAQKDRSMTVKSEDDFSEHSQVDPVNNVNVYRQFLNYVCRLTIEARAGKSSGKEPFYSLLGLRWALFLGPDSLH